MIEKDIAQNIVERMKEIIQQEINFFSTTGTIIASTDPTRIGQEKHEGAIAAMKEKDIIIISYDNEYAGAKQGINLPVSFQSKIVGAIGITGKHNEVIQYGKIIKQMTEILILNTTAHSLIFNRRNINQHIIDHILNPSNDTISTIETLYGIDLNLPRVAIIGTLSPESSAIIQDFSSLYLEIEQLVGKNSQHIFDIRGHTITILLHYTSQSKLVTFINKLTASLSEKLNITVHIGVGLSSVHSSLNNSISQAYTALKWQNAFSSQNVCYYQDLHDGIVLHTIPEENTKTFLSSVFKNMSDKAIKEAIHLLRLYEQHNGSIQSCAEALFVHKNTVQYKLNKIKDETGYSPRNLSDFYILKLASVLYTTHRHT